MASVITIAGEKLFAAKAQANEQLDIDTFIFANVPGQDATAPINREEGLPADNVVHQQIVQQVGRINDNVVVYSTVLDSITGPFEFNWVGLYSSINNTLVAINHIPSTTKTITVPGAAGNTLNRNFGIEYSGIADLTGIDVAPETWQLDFTARLQGMDKLTQQLATDMNGKDWFIDDGFKVEPRETVNTFKILSGVGYVSGLRVELKNEHIFNVESYPKFVYVDAWFEGDANSTWSPSLSFSVTSLERGDYEDESGVKHYVNKLAEITEFEMVSDLREPSKNQKDIEELENKSLTKTKEIDDVDFNNRNDFILDYGIYNKQEPIIMSTCKKLIGQGREAAKNNATVIKFTGDGMIVGNGIYTNGIEISSLVLQGSSVGVGLNLSGEISEAVTEATLRNIRIENFDVGYKSLYAWSNVIESMRIHGCKKPFQIDSQGNNTSFTQINVSGGSEHSTFKNAEGVYFESFNLVNTTGEITFSLFQSYVTINNPYFEVNEGNVLIGSSNEVNKSSLTLNGGLIANGFIIKSSGVFLTINGSRNSHEESFVDSGVNLPSYYAILDIKTVSLGDNEPKMNFRGWHLYTDAKRNIKWPMASGGSQLESLLYRDYYTLSQSGLFNGIRITNDLIVGEQYCLVIAMTKEEGTGNVTIRSGSRTATLHELACPVSSNADGFIVRHLPFVAADNDLKLIFSGTLRIKGIAVSKGIVNTGDVDFLIDKPWRSSSMPMQGYWDSGDYVENTQPTILGEDGAKYIVKGWKRITSNYTNILNVDWVECRSVTGL